MNTTRSFWSDNCCKYRRKSEYVFLGTTVVSFTVAALFYFLAKVCTDIKVTTILPRKCSTYFFLKTLLLFFLQKTDLLVPSIFVIDK